MELYFATGNEGKVEDAREILEQPVEQVEVEVVEPCLDSIEEIARAKVEQAVEKSQLHGAHLMADDSGLFVDDLDGFPGRNTSFFDRKVGKEALLDLVEEGADAEFRAAVALRDPETGEVEVFTGKVEGELVEPRGDGGFGYDPMFLPDGHDETFAEDPGYKHEVSHRREALESLAESIRG